MSPTYGDDKNCNRLPTPKYCPSSIAGEIHLGCAAKYPEDNRLSYLSVAECGRRAAKKASPEVAKILLLYAEDEARRASTFSWWTVIGMTKEQVLMGWAPPLYA